MMLVAAALLGLTALGGIALLTLRLRGGNPPLLMVRAHGLLGGLGLTTLLVSILVQRSYGAPVVAFVVLSGAAGLGLWMAKQHGNGQLVPIGAVFLHVLVVLLGGSALASHLLG